MNNFEQHEASNNEEKIKNLLYKSIEMTYRYVMDSGGGKYLGYSAGVGFEVEGIEWHEPSLQRLLSQLHLKKDLVSAKEYIQLFTNTINALRNFNYLEDVSPDCQQEFVDLGCPRIIMYVADELEKVISELEQ